MRSPNPDRGVGCVGVLLFYYGQAPRHQPSHPPMGVFPTTQPQAANGAGGGGGVVGWGLLSRNRIVDAACLPTHAKGVWWFCGVSHRPISTGQLHGSLVPASTSCLSTQWSGWGPLTPEGVWKSHLEVGFPLRCFQRLSLPNVANQRCTWQYN